MFIGEYRHSLDNKGRIIVPSRFREELGDSFVLTRGLDTCLFGFAMDEWRTQEAKLTSLPMTMADGRAFSRLFFSGASECELDRQGRALVPGHLREYAKINRDIVIIGVSSRFEVWGAEAWDEYLARVSGSYEAIAEKLVSLQ
ncbi:MAG: division/cell wall cluster transcriptional repressor MraZ [Clostridia bacterium]|nr:division/cell wall cluster transcriptional repressor MraZ [Clostridia bacterium]